jgi:hypothetical protein
MNQTNRLWMKIFQIVKDTCTGEYSGANPQGDITVHLLSARKGSLYIFQKIVDIDAA